MNYKNKNKIIITSIVLSLVGFIFSNNIVLASEITPENIVEAVNKERQLRMIKPLRVDYRLASAAENKSMHMLSKNYFDHYAFGLTPWSFIIASNYDYQIAGENLALGFSSAEGIVGAWMNSSSHRENILNPEFQDIGVGIVRGEYIQDGNKINTTITTKMLAKPKPLIPRFIDQITNSFYRLFK